MQHQLDRAAAALACFAVPKARLIPITTGHINATYRVEHSDRRWLLQQVNPLFAPETNGDIVAIVAHLHAAGIIAPDLLCTREGNLWHTDDEGGVWRLMTYIDGAVLERCTTVTQCRAVGELLGRVHRALANVQHTFAAPRLGVHDTAAHLDKLDAALASHRDHDAYRQIAPLAFAIVAHGRTLPRLDLGRPRIIHGDPKISNFIFDESGRATAVIDFDTLAAMPVALELGDALRSWCSPGGEDPAEAGFVLSHFEAALTGYRAGAGDLLSADEIRDIGPALPVIATELAARFIRDALEESYFGWDRSTYSRAWQHNLVRAQSQWALIQSFAAQADTARAVVARVLA